jgi:hypothetical protein
MDLFTPIYVSLLGIIQQSPFISEPNRGFMFNNGRLNCDAHHNTLDRSIRKEVLHKIVLDTEPCC